MTRGRVSGILLIVSFLLCLGGVALFVRREELGGSSLFTWERGLLMAGYVAAAVGVVVLASALPKLRSALDARVSAITFLLAVVFAVTAEASLLMQGFSFDENLGVAMVVFLFLAEAIVGAALLRSGLVPAWLAWTMILWNFLWPVVLLIVSSGDMYFPILHFLPLLFAGVSLVTRATKPTGLPSS